jgi:GPH family glycoside/pentoside/hexuronide:cation symporter
VVSEAAIEEGTIAPRARAGLSAARRVAALYALPAIAGGFMGNMIGFYFMKYSTDVLLLAPGAIGAIFGASRIWDAVTDPFAGYLSDKTRTRWGRRRPWMLAFAIPLAVSFVALWSPPRGLSDFGLLVWLAVAIFGFSTAVTGFGMPYGALGAELSTDYHERTRIFTWAKIAGASGGLLGLAALAPLISQSADQRSDIPLLALAVALFSLPLTAYSVAKLRERPENWGRGPRSPWAAVRDVWRNQHARPLLAAGLLGTLGGGSAKLAVPYACEYVLGDLELMPVVLVGYIVPMILAQPIWLPLSQRFDKREVWMAASLLQALGLGAFFFGTSIPFWLLLAFVALAGACDGGTGVLGLSIKADVIDADELATGERKEGAYFAMWGLAMKTSFGIAIFLVGFVLEFAGFEAGQAQSEPSLFAIRALQAIVPFIFLSLGCLCMTRLRLNAAEHQRIREALARRARGTDEP